MVTAEKRITHNEYQFDGKAVIIPLVSSTGHGHASLKRVHYQEGKFAIGSILAAVVVKDEEVYPIEVKAGLSGKLKSLNVFSQKYNTPYRTRISGRNLEINHSASMHSYPLYLAYKFPLD